MLVEDRVWRERFPDLHQVREVEGEAVPGLVARQAFLRRHQALEPRHGPIHPRKVPETLLDEPGELALQLLKVFYCLPDGQVIELEGLGHIIKDSKVIDDQPVSLRVGVGAVGAADGLQEGVVPQRLVEIHRLQDRRVEAREQLCRDDQNLERVGGVAKPLEQLFLGVTVAVVLPVGLELRPLLARYGDHDV